MPAAKAAQVDHFVRTLPDGYEMVLNEEASNISEGQKQLMTILSRATTTHEICGATALSIKMAAE